MIAQLTGKLIHKEPTYIIIDVGGVGYELHISLHTYDQIKLLDSCTILSVMHGKSDSYTLYGFYTIEEKSWWSRLISINNIGPRSALTILSSLHPNTLHQAILEKNESLLASIKGIGKKAAQRIILELSHKAKQLHYDGTPNSSQLETTINQDAIAALTTLGIPKKVAEKAIETVRAKYAQPLTLEELVKKALHPNK